MPTRLQRIQQKLDGLRAEDADFRCFGAYQHQYRLGPPLTQDRLVKLESFYQIQLPSDYREFLLQIGNGGAGPGYGLQRFGASRMKPRPFVDPGAGLETPRRYADNFKYLYWDTVRILAEDRGLLARKCPLSNSVRLEEVDAPDDETAYDDWLENIWGRFDDGMLPLAQLGCGMVVKLVVSGRRRGSIWIDDECDGEWYVEYKDAHGLQPGELQPKTYRFLDWYEHWLDHAAEDL